MLRSISTSTAMRSTPTPADCLGSRVIVTTLSNGAPITLRLRLTPPLSPTAEASVDVIPVSPRYRLPQVGVEAASTPRTTSWSDHGRLPFRSPRYCRLTPGLEQALTVVMTARRRGCVVMTRSRREFSFLPLAEPKCRGKLLDLIDPVATFNKDLCTPRWKRSELTPSSQLTSLRSNAHAS